MMKTTNKLNEVTSQYKPGAATEIENDLMLNWYPNRILKRLEGSGVKSLLELGLGHGYTSVLFKRFFERHVIVEGSSIVIDIFKKNNKILNIEIVESYFENFSTQEKFDVIIMGFVLEHVDDPGVIFDHFKKFLTQDGRLFVAVPNAKSLNRRLGLELGMIDDIYDLNENDLALGHQRQFCRKTLKSLLSEHGLKADWEEGIYLKPLPLAFIQQLPRFRDNLQAMLEVGIDFPDLCVGLLMEVREK